MREGVEEPTYEYLKGQGWVPCIHETITFIMGDYRITLVARKPEPHERWFAEPPGTKLTKTAESIQGQDWRLRDMEKHMGNIFTENGWTTKLLLDSERYTWVTLSYERIKR